MNSTVSRSFVYAALVAAFAGGAGRFAFAATATVIHVFNGATDGFQPAAAVQIDRAGAVFGTTLFGGTSNFGVVYQLVPPGQGQSDWTEKILHDFENGADGGSPWSAVSVLPDGSLLGSTLGGGNGGGGVGGFGELWQLTPTGAGQTGWTERTLHNFTGEPDGQGPIGGLLKATDHRYYGVTSFGGASGAGSVYELVHDTDGRWTTRVIYSLTGGNDGGQPQNRLIADEAGDLYGTAQVGGPFGLGAVFELTPPDSPGAPWTETTIWGFNGSGGEQPRSGVTLMTDGSLVGTTFAGGRFGRGVAYRLVPPSAGERTWSQQVLHAFTGRADGGDPDGGLTLDEAGGLYGTASAGSEREVGEVFHLQPTIGGPWRLTTVHAFQGRQAGGGPTGDLVLHDRVLYGVTLGNISLNAASTVYTVAP